MAKLGKIMCKLGIHKWGKPRIHMIVSSNVKDYEKYCKRCKKMKRWSKPRED